MDGHTEMKYAPFARILHDPPFHCGFHPDQHTYREYVQHIENCTDFECERRYTNHLLLKAYFIRKYGESSATDPNVTSKRA